MILALEKTAGNELLMLVLVVLSPTHISLPLAVFTFPLEPLFTHPFCALQNLLMSHLRTARPRSDSVLWLLSIFLTQDHRFLFGGK